jgi:hypothetical protein
MYTTDKLGSNCYISWCSAYASDIDRILEHLTALIVPKQAQSVAFTVIGRGTPNLFQVTSPIRQIIDAEKVLASLPLPLTSTPPTPLDASLGEKDEHACLSLEQWSRAGQAGADP